MKKKSKLLLALCAMLVMMFSMSVLTYAEGLQKPGTVTGLKQVDASETGVKVEWKADKASDCYYDIYISETGKEGSFVKDSSYRVDDTDWNFYGLKAGKTYYVKVIAFTYSYPDSLYADSYSKTLKVVTSPTQVTGVKQTNATKDSVTLQWNKVNGASGYRIYNQIYDKNNGYTLKLLTTTSKTKAMVKNLKSSQEYNLYVYAYRKGDTYVAEQEYAKSDGYISAYDLRIVPAKISATKIKIVNYYQALEEVNVTWPESDYAEGYQVQVFAYNGKNSKYTLTVQYHSAYLDKIDASRFYKFRIRGYVTVNNAKKYGEWSSYKYVAQQPKVSVTQAKTTKRQAVFKWDKMAGATSYTVYMSTKQTSGYKKVGTTSKNTLTVSKLGNSNLQKNKTYYVYVVANRKSGSSVYKSGAEYCWKFSLPK